MEKEKLKNKTPESKLRINQSSILDLWVIEYSLKQKCYNICRVYEMLLHNKRNAIIDKYEKFQAFIPIGIFRTNEEANTFLTINQIEIQGGMNKNE